jgi:nucleoside 2-deoxyribosyltransferase
MRKKIYFAASIRSGRDDQRIYVEIINSLKKYGTVLSEHFGSPSLTSMGHNNPVNDIYQQDKKWVSEADIVVAEVTTPSLGVGMELGWAEEWSKKVICFYREQDNRRLSALVDGSPAFSVYRYQTLAEVREILKKELGKLAD